MRRPYVSLTAAFISICGWLSTGWADEFNPFAELVSSEEVQAPLSPAEAPPLPAESFDAPLPEVYETPGTEFIPVPQQGHPEGEPFPVPHEEHGEHHQFHEPGKMHGHEMHGEGHTEEHGGHEHFEHHEAHHHHHHAHEHEHEEELGNIRITPLYREIESDLWNKVFDSMYSVNIGTTFWQHERNHGSYNTQVGLVTEFQYSALEGKSNTNISSAVSNVFGFRENIRVKDADIYGGNIGLSFVANTYLPDSCTKLELGFTPLVTVGSLNANLIANQPTAIQPSIVLRSEASKNGTIVGGDFRLWTGIKTESGFRAGITGFYGVSETDAIFDSSETFNTYGGGVYVEIPTRFVPHEFPAPIGTFQWIEELFGLH
ncbi:MAG: hypothetical protein KDA84_25750 [Planctomycetaceae bacterium]|nr:hypothetical protein [Planctomycetaceae bacterium]